MLTETQNDISPPAGEILFFGSSILAQWSSLKQDMPELPVHNHAIGGMRTWEALYHGENLVFPFAPKVVVYYCGSNDINFGQDANAIFARTQLFFDRLWSHNAEAKILYISIIKAPQKRDRWFIADTVNERVQALAAEDARLTYLDINPSLSTADGEPNLALYQDDLLHYKPETYQVFAEVVKPVLTALVQP